MIYIVGHRFRIGAIPVVRAGGSIMEKMAMQNRPAPKSNDPDFIQDHVVKLVRISTEKVDNIQKYRYHYLDEDTGVEFSKLYDYTADAEDVIARLSGKLNDLQTTREHIQKMYENAT